MTKGNIKHISNQCGNLILNLKSCKFKKKRYFKIKKKERKGFAFTLGFSYEVEEKKLENSSFLLKLFIMFICKIFNPFSTEIFLCKPN
jgi:hypothetical protein